ncbi:hypothetical protein LIER_02528 [Lithospermum erythrorhizon]|uniref:Uncharacterized protein n=1 Tax=Lithospermum erythrorhizon TaxID=34254 RepID=A0AAV3NR14_LITER
MMMTYDLFPSQFFSDSEFEQVDFQQQQLDILDILQKILRNQQRQSPSIEVISDNVEGVEEKQNLSKLDIQEVYALELFDKFPQSNIFVDQVVYVDYGDDNDSALDEVAHTLNHIYANNDSDVNGDAKTEHVIYDVADVEQFYATLMIDEFSKKEENHHYVDEQISYDEHDDNVENVIGDDDQYEDAIVNVKSAQEVYYEVKAVLEAMEFDYGDYYTSINHHLPEISISVDNYFNPKLPLTKLGNSSMNNRWSFKSEGLDEVLNSYNTKLQCNKVIISNETKLEGVCNLAFTITDGTCVWSMSITKHSCGEVKDFLSNIPPLPPRILYVQKNMEEVWNSELSELSFIDAMESFTHLCDEQFDYGIHLKTYVCSTTITYVCQFAPDLDLNTKGLFLVSECRFQIFFWLSV